MKDFGNRLKIVRDEQGLTRKELADKAGVTDKTIQRWEDGGNIPAIGVIKKLGDILGHNFLKKEESGGVLSDSEGRAYLIRNNALLTVILDAQAEILASNTGKTVSEVRSSLMNSVKTMEEELRAAHTHRKL